MAINNVQIMGRLTADPELKYTNSGKAVAKLTLAVDRPKRNNGEKETDFIDCVLWEKTAEVAAEYLVKGNRVFLEGRLQLRSYENNEGRKVKVAEVVVHRMEFIDTKNNGNGGNNQQTSTSRQQPSSSSPRSSMSYNDPFADDGGTIDISDDDLPF
jgi:single-strand DNA-binding protein